VVLLDLKDLATPGWLPLLLTGILLLLCALLAWSMFRHLRKIDVPVDQDHPESSRFARPEE
jgi:hypothetical protein